MNCIGAEINKQIKENVYNISVEDVIEGVQRLKLVESDGEEGLNSVHIIHGPRRLFVLLTLAFNSTLAYGHSPYSMLMGTIIHMPKDKRQFVCTSDDFRAIPLRRNRNNMRLQYRI